jgi:hypothetical protein
VNSYEYRQQCRADRLAARAARQTAEGQRRLDAGDALARQMDGQPILVGHHSERRHRRQIDQMWQHSRAGFALLKTAEETARRAGAVGTGGISSDDPDGPAKLREKLTRLEAERDRGKAINAEFRKGDGWAARAALTEDEQREVALTFRCGHRQPYPGWWLTNIGARIRTVRERIGQLEALQARQAAEAAADVTPRPVVRGIVTVTEDVQENRLCLTFARRLTRDEWRAVRRHGFVWSRTRGAAVRKITAAARHAAAAIADNLSRETPPSVSRETP